MRKIIKNENELEFVIFCIENVANKLDVEAEKVYLCFDKNKIINEYLVPSYEVLHTQSKEYIVNDIIEFLHKRRITIC